MTQPSLFTDPDQLPDAGPRPRARRTDPVSSHLAAEENAASGTRARHYDAILKALAGENGMTSDEIARKAGMDRVAVARRMAEMERNGQVRRGEIRKSRLTGRPGLCWYAI